MKRSLAVRAQIRAISFPDLVEVSVESLENKTQLTHAERVFSYSWEEAKHRCCIDDDSHVEACERYFRSGRTAELGVRQAEIEIFD